MNQEDRKSEMLFGDERKIEAMQVISLHVGENSLRVEETFSDRAWRPKTTKHSWKWEGQVDRERSRSGSNTPIEFE